MDYDRSKKKPCNFKIGDCNVLMGVIIVKDEYCVKRPWRTGYRATLGKRGRNATERTLNGILLS